MRGIPQHLSRLIQIGELMIDGKSVLAIVPARAGSKGLPNKNIMPIAGKPLIAWTLEQALDSRLVDAIFVSTDSEMALEIAREYSAVRAPSLRPRELAQDTTPSIDVIEHVIRTLREQGETFDYTVLLEPTSPLREPNDIDNMIALLHEQAASFDSIVSVGIARQSPALMKRLDGNRLVRYDPALPVSTRRQDDETLYFPFGVGYVCKTSVLMTEGTFYTDRATWYPLKRYQEYEIDDVFDFYCVEKMMETQWRI